jgi:hypothetical protein
MCNFQNDDTLGKLSSAPHKICIGKISDYNTQSTPISKTVFKNTAILVADLDIHIQIVFSLSAQTWSFSPLAIRYLQLVP